MDSKEWVKNFFEYCENNDISPWKLDFKRFYTDDEDESSSIELWLKYRLNKIDEPQLDNSLNEKLDGVFRLLRQYGQQKDPDKVGFPIYDVLGWQKTPDDEVRGESMNSFKTTFTKDIVSTEDYRKIYKRIKIDVNGFLDKQYDVLLKDKNYLQFKIINENESEIEKFACLTHTIGNFIVLPYKINTTRGSSRYFRDYWDITLQSIYDLFKSIGDDGMTAWKSFIEKYYLQPFVNHDETYSVGELWTGHFNTDVYPTKNEDFKQFYQNTNLLIEERGKWLTKELYNKLQLQDSAFYQKELVNKDKIKFFNEIDGVTFC